MTCEVICCENILGMTAPMSTRGCAFQVKELLRSLMGSAERAQGL